MVRNRYAMDVRDRPLLQDAEVYPAVCGKPITRILPEYQPHDSAGWKCRYQFIMQALQMRMPELILQFHWQHYCLITSQPMKGPSS